MPDPIANVTPRMGDLGRVTPRNAGSGRVLDSDTCTPEQLVALLPVRYRQRMRKRPVSYTHLDVYKRQTITKAILFAAVEVPVRQQRIETFRRELRSLYPAAIIGR